MTLHLTYAGWKSRTLKTRSETLSLRSAGPRHASGTCRLAPLMLLPVLLLVTCFPVSGKAQEGIDHGPTGTLNLDYFNPDRDAHIEWLKKDVKRAHLKKAKRWLRAGHPDRAIRDLRFILDRFINHPEALLVLGLVSKLTKNYSLTIHHYKKALKIYPQYAITHAQYGLFLTEIGNIRAGIGKLERAIELNPNLAVAHVWIAKAHLKSGNTELARQAKARARKLGYKEKSSLGQRR